MYSSKEKAKIRNELKKVLDHSDKIKFVTKTRFLMEIAKIRKKNNIQANNMLSCIFSELQGATNYNLKETLLKSTTHALNRMYSDDKKLLTNTLKRIKNKNIILSDTKSPLPSYIIQIAKQKNKDNVVDSNSSINFKHADMILIPINLIDPNGNMVTNKKGVLLLKKAIKLEIPVVGYIQSLNFVKNIKEESGKKIKPEFVESLISDIGIFEPEIYVQELKIKKPWLFS